MTKLYITNYNLSSVRTRRKSEEKLKKNDSKKVETCSANMGTRQRTKKFADIEMKGSEKCNFTKGLAKLDRVQTSQKFDGRNFKIQFLGLFQYDNFF